MKKRAYRMSARAEATTLTGARITEAMRALFAAHPYDHITIAMIAKHAGVTLQTVLRRFGSKESLLAAAAAEAAERINAQRDDAPVGDVRGATRNLFDHYETWGRIALRLLEQEERSAPIAALTRRGREMHVAWIDRVYAPMLRARRGAARERLRSQLVALCDVYTWKILVVDRRRDRADAERCVVEMIEALLANKDGR